MPFNNELVEEELAEEEENRFTNKENYYFIKFGRQNNYYGSREKRFNPEFPNISVSSAKYSNNSSVFSFIGQLEDDYDDDNY